MVYTIVWLNSLPLRFQYSLCRVVLMVVIWTDSSPAQSRLSVLALSSRFDGPELEPRHPT